MWGGKCFNCFYKAITGNLKTTKKIDVLKVQNRAGVKEDFEGVQYTVLADLFLHLPSITDKIQQITMTTAYTTDSLTDTVGREAEHAWNMYATQRLLSKYQAFDSVAVKGPKKLQPVQFDHLLGQARVDNDTCYYHHSFVKIPDTATLLTAEKSFEAWQPAPPARALKAEVPGYCTVPSQEEDDTMQAWVNQEMKSRCHPTRLAVPCVRTRLYDAIIPCPQELMNNLAEDYANMKNWCKHFNDYAAIQPLTKVDPGASAAFQKAPYKRGVGIRLAFFFTVYADAAFVIRLFNHLYSRNHYYMLHIDPAGSSPEFERDLRQMASNYTNVFLAKDVPIVYGASTATILLTKAMAWFNKHATGWDYFVPLTGSDYPLLPLHRMEKIFLHQQPPMPFVMAWTPGTSTHLFRLGKTHEVFETDPYLAKSIKAVTDERGALLGAVPMEYRSTNFGPPLFCNDRSSFYHLDNRGNKSGLILDTQWLFPRDVFPGRGRAYAEENPIYAIPSADGVWRVWKKSDPATTGAYDKETVDYIVNSEEGRKYWHFFKHMLLGSEEHYYVSLLYNWPRTKAFIQTLSAEIVWNTWELGLWEQSSGFQTHTHFLTLNEWDIIKGFSMRGMMFARKFSSKKTAAVLDRIDEHILHNDSTDAGLYWPGFFPTDITSPGKIWIAEHRRNASLKAQARKAAIAAMSKDGRAAKRSSVTV